MLTIHHNPFSQHARRVLALLEIADIPYEAQLVKLDAGEHVMPAFMKLNPNHQVPVLVDGELTLSESNAILRYLCGKYSLTDWYPEDIEQRARVDMWLDWNQCRLARPVIDIVLNKVFMGDQANADEIERGEAILPELGNILAGQLLQGEFLCGEQATIADLAVASNITQLSLADAVPDHEAIHNWYTRMCEIDGFRKTLPPPMANAA